MPTAYFPRTRPWSTVLTLSMTGRGRSLPAAILTWWSVMRLTGLFTTNIRIFSPTLTRLSSGLRLRPRMRLIRIPTKSLSWKTAFPPMGMTWPRRWRTGIWLITFPLRAGWSLWSRGLCMTSCQRRTRRLLRIRLKMRTERYQSGLIPLRWIPGFSMRTPYGRCWMWWWAMGLRWITARSWERPLSLPNGMTMRRRSWRCFTESILICRILPKL